jgi:DNA-binding NtrC family response regulator
MYLYPWHNIQEMENIMYDIGWLVENEIIYFYIAGTITEDDLVDTDAQVNHLINQSDRDLVHIVFDDINLEEMPGLKALRDLTYPRHERVGWIITSNQNKIMRFIANLVGQMAQVRYRFFDSPEDGIDFLVSVDTRLPTADTLKDKLHSIRREQSLKS